ncbi:MAG: T9SS type A sorting domain-containing protein [Flavobacteriales bacterium]|jgi:hypothetical protein|nr:T9SS type A sorting domain-containing protein [Flavobacteriales bacterium]
MKRILLSALSLIALNSMNAQQVSDMISTGAGNSNAVFYSLEDGEVSNITNEDWDLAFNTSIFGVDIRINDGKGVQLYTYPNGDTSDFATVDTAGISGWSQNYNSSESWDYGAFNTTANGSSFDYGWGAYNPTTHYVTGDSVYVIKTLAGNYKKIWIQTLANGHYNYKYANLDNSNTVSESIQLSNYSDKNYFYYSLDNGTVIDREPATGTWDFVAMKYLAPQPQGGYYPSTGILMNRGLKTREARNVSTATALWSDYTEEEAIDVIGFDWKSFDFSTYSYIMEDDLSYFVTDRAGNIWHIIFTAFGGSTNGNIEFTKEMISAVSIEENNGINLGLYPNPASNQVTFLYELENDAVITIYDLQGKTVYNNEFYGAGFNQQTIDVSFLNSGIYNVMIQSENRVGTQKLVIE